MSPSLRKRPADATQLWFVRNGSYSRSIRYRYRNIYLPADTYWHSDDATRPGNSLVERNQRFDDVLRYVQPSYNIFWSHTNAHYSTEHTTTSRLRINDRPKTEGTSQGQRNSAVAMTLRPHDLQIVGNEKPILRLIHLMYEPADPGQS